MNESTYRRNIIQLVNRIHNAKSLQLIYEYVEYLYLNNELEADA